MQAPPTQATQQINELRQSLSAPAKESSGKSLPSPSPESPKKPEPDTTSLTTSATSQPKKVTPLNPNTLVQATSPSIKPFTAYERLRLKQNQAETQWRARTLSQQLAGSGETLDERMAMAMRLEQVLPPQEKPVINALLANGTLTETAGDDPHSTLYHLYALISTPRAPGLHPVGLLRNTLMLLARPQNPHQDFAPLDTDLKKALRQMMRQPTYDTHQPEDPVRLPELNELDVVDSNNCAAASEQSRLASKQRKELARIVNEMTSPQLTILEKATAQQLSPEDPTNAEALLKQACLSYHKLPDNKYLIQLPVPRLALPRALMAQRLNHPKLANTVEVLLQDTFLYNFTCKSYDAATDARDTLDMAAVAINQASSLTDEQKEQLVQVLQEAGSWGEARQNLMQAVKQVPNVSDIDLINILQGARMESYGLTEIEKTLMERVMGDDEAVASVLYQIEGGPAQATPFNQDKIFVYGYSRPLDAILNDLTSTLDTGQEVILGMAATAEQGDYGADGLPMEQGFSYGGHEVKVHDYIRHPQTGEILFRVTDSDDYYYDPDTGTMQAHEQTVDARNPDLRIIPASELIPKIHHMGLPFTKAQAIWNEMKAKPQQFYLPDLSDTQRYQIMPISPEQPPDTIFLPGEQLQLEDLAKQQQEQEENAGYLTVDSANGEPLSDDVLKALMGPKPPAYSTSPNDYTPTALASGASSPDAASLSHQKPVNKFSVLG